MTEWLWILVACFAVMIVLWAPALVRSWRTRSSAPSADRRQELLAVLAERCLAAEDLIAVVRPYAEHERWIFDQLATTARRLEDAVASGNDRQIVDADRQFETARHDVLSVAQAYPDLVGAPAFTDLYEESVRLDLDRLGAIRAYAGESGAISAEAWCGVSGRE